MGVLRYILIKLVSSRVNIAALLVLLLAGTAFYFGFGITMQAPSWTYPLFSAAQTWSPFSDVFINGSQYREFSVLNLQERIEFRFSSIGNNVRYDYFPSGLIWLIAVAQTMFFFLSPIKALVLLQFCVHVSLSLILFRRLSGVWAWMWLLLYGVNPLVLKFVFFPFYYFWTFLASFAFLFLYLNQRKQISNFGLIMLGGAIFLSISTRPTALFIGLFACAVCFIWHSRKWAIGYVFLCLFAFNLASQGGMQIWHTVYIGLGAHDSKYLPDLSDDNGATLYYQKTAERFDVDPVSGELGDADKLANYSNVLRGEYLTILRNDPSYVLFNALRNVTSGYSFGYLPGNKFIQVAAQISGLMFVVLLLVYRQWVYFLAVGLSIGAFALYFPPIAAYMYGSYSILVIAALSLLRKNNGQN